MQQIQQLEMQKHAIELNNTQSHENNDSMHQNNFQNNSYNEQSFPESYDQNKFKLYGSESGDNYPSNNSLSGNENSYDSQAFNDKHRNDNNDEPDLSELLNINFSQPPPGYKPKEEPLAFQNGLPDLSKPPPGFAPFPEPVNEELMPSVPYFELPAGLMVPLIRVRTLFASNTSPNCNKF